MSGSKGAHSCTKTFAAPSSPPLSASTLIASKSDIGSHQEANPFAEHGDYTHRAPVVEHPLRSSTRQTKRGSTSPSLDTPPKMSADEQRPVNAGHASLSASYGGASTEGRPSNISNASRPSSRPTSSYQGRRQPPFLSRQASSMRMASHASLGSGLEGRTSADQGQNEDSGPSWRATAQGATPLDRTMDAIGMGPYQYAVLILTGFGWAADNMWLQGVAITLPRMQDEWAISDQWIGLVSSSTFAGMMLGALAWGSYADSFGRVTAFNITLLITSIFGMLSAFAPSFPLLCLCLFFLGTGVGGSMPTDGTIFLEALPKRYHYLVTALSVFFAAGSVVTSLLGLYLVPPFSCGGASPCHVEDNKGWRYLLGALGLLTLFFVIARLLFFTLLESPKYLVSAGKHEEARTVLQRIAAFNGDPKRVRLADVSDREGRTQSYRDTASRLGTSRPQSKIARGVSPRISEDDDAPETRGLMADAEGDVRRNARSSTVIYDESTQEEEWPDKLAFVPQGWRPSLSQSVKRYSELFQPHWKKTTTLVWLIWTLFTLAYTMVNVFLPKYLESRTGAQHQAITPKGADDIAARRSAMASVMREFVFYSLASLPGSLLGAWLIETPLGRIKSMAFSTLFLALSLLAFALLASTALLVIMSSCAISLFASIAYAVIYSYSPEVFATRLRGTACGTASALSRMAGIVAPVLAGALMSIGGINLPLYVGFLLFFVVVWLELALPYETRGRDTTTGDAA